MRVQHNIVAMNSYRNYNNNTKSINKNLEKLSSGYKINRAGDDAAGLAISEKMRAQITGLEGAQKNAKDGISLVQTAEGALTEVHSMLNRMYSLAEQSANGTYNDEVDREQLQKEVEKLSTEIDRIADSSNFNGLKLLDGSLSGTGGASSTAVKLGDNIKSDKVDATQSDFTYTIGNEAGNVFKSAAEGLSTDGDKAMFSFTYSEGIDGTPKTVDFAFTLTTENGSSYLVSDSGKKYDFANAKGSEVLSALKSELGNSALSKKFTFTATINDTANTGSVYFQSIDKGSGAAVMQSLNSKTVATDGTTTVTTALDGNTNKVAVNLGADVGRDVDGKTGVTEYDGTNADNAVFTINGQKFALADVSGGTDVSALGKGVTVLDGNNTSGFTDAHAALIKQKTGLDVVADGAGLVTLRGGEGTAASGGLQLQIGDTGDSFNQMKVDIKDIHSKAIGIGGIDISTVDGATAAMDAIKDAINYVSDVRGGLGATQNRLEHTINNLSVMQENIQDAESTIRDTDVADEMMKYTKNSILVQSAQAMLAQANQQPQGVLQLLQ